MTKKRRQFSAEFKLEAVRLMGQAQHSRAMRVQTRMQRGATGTALRRRAEAAREAHAARGQRVEGRRIDRRLPVATEVLPEVVAGENQDRRRSRHALTAAVGATRVTRRRSD